MLLFKVLGIPHPFQLFGLAAPPVCIQSEAPLLHKALLKKEKEIPPFVQFHEFYRNKPQKGEKKYRRTIYPSIHPSMIEEVQCLIQD